MSRAPGAGLDTVAAPAPLVAPPPHRLTKPEWRSRLLGWSLVAGPLTALMEDTLRRARKGAAAGPSDHISELCRLVLDDEASGLAFVRTATDLARAQVAPGIATAITVTSFVRSIAIFFRPAWFVSTRALAHALQAATEAGVGAFDTVSRLAMLTHVPGASACLPFVRQFYAALCGMMLQVGRARLTRQKAVNKATR